MERLIWLSTQPLNPVMVADVSGTFASEVNGTECVLEFVLNANGVLKGVFSAEGEVLHISGGISARTGMAFGFLLEINSNLPVGVFRAKRTEDGMNLELDVPDFDELFDHCNPERIVFRRVLDAWEQP